MRTQAQEIKLSQIKCYRLKNEEDYSCGTTVMFTAFS
jgi:hypothetical protein